MTHKTQYNLKNKNDLCILVLGGLGFIGSHISRSLLKEGYSVAIFDKLYGSRKLVIDIENDITTAILFLIQSGFITGQVLFVDGGYHMKGNTYGC